MESTSLSLCNNSRKSSSIHSIMSLLILFCIFSCIPLCYGEEDSTPKLHNRYGEYCSTSPSHFVKCSHYKAKCVNSTMTQYGVCECPYLYHAIHFIDVTQKIVVTDCLMPRDSKESQCDNSLQCQFEDMHSVCANETRGMPSCHCRDIDQYYEGFDKMCTENTVLDTDWTLYHLGGFIVFLFILGFICFCFKCDFDDAVDALAGAMLEFRIWFCNRWYEFWHRGSESEESTPSSEDTPLNPRIQFQIQSSTPQTPPPGTSFELHQFRERPPHQMKHQVLLHSDEERDKSPGGTDRFSDISSTSIGFTSPALTNEPSYTKDPLGFEISPSGSNEPPASSHSGSTPPYEDAVSRMASPRSDQSEQNFQ